MKDVDHGVELRGVYDGICYWVMKDGTYVNRFSQESRPDQWYKTELALCELRGCVKVTSHDELEVLPIGTVLLGNFTRVYDNEPAGLDWVIPPSRMGYHRREIKLPTYIVS